MRYHTFVVDIRDALKSRLFGQDGAVQAIDEQLTLHASGLMDRRRPAGVFLLYGPTGSGKTHTIEALAEVLAGNQSSYIRVDCGLLQKDHEIARLTGAPPGYLGHRETQPPITNESLARVAGDSGLSIVLIDEVEKASPALHRALLGVFDKGELILGDNRKVTFHKTLVFLTSNLASALVVLEKRHKESKELKATAGSPGSLMEMLKPGQSLTQLNPEEVSSVTRPLTVDEMRLVFTHAFSPEFINRVDHIIPFEPMDDATARQIIAKEMETLQALLVDRLDARGFALRYTPKIEDLILHHSNVEAWGARDIKRAIHRHVTLPLARLINSGQYPACGCVDVFVTETGEVAFACTENTPDTSDALMPMLLKATLATYQWRKRTGLPALKQ